jgi:hypothetical protein
LPALTEYLIGWVDLDSRINRFLKANAKLFTREQWLEAYPKATETS